jgi:hypothetical protein
MQLLEKDLHNGDANSNVGNVNVHKDTIIKQYYKYIIIIT